MIRFCILIAAVLADMANSVDWDYNPVNIKTFDLSYPYNNKTVHWPNSSRFKFVRMIRENKSSSHWYAANDFCTGEHTGTHLDAPYHFYENGLKVGEIPIANLINRAFVLNVETFNDNANSDESTTLEPRHILAFEKKLFGPEGKLPKHCILLVRFNWGRYYGTPQYLNLKAATANNQEDYTLSFPGIGPDAARLLVERKVAGVGVDTASIDLGSSTTFDSHTIFAEANIFTMENVNIPKDLVEFNDGGLVVYAFPMNIWEGTGAPVRVVAVVPRKLKVM